MHHEFATFIFNNISLHWPNQTKADIIDYMHSSAKIKYVTDFRSGLSTYTHWHMTICNVRWTKAMKSSPLLEPFCNLKFCGFSLFKIKVGCYDVSKLRLENSLTVNQCTAVQCLQIWTLIHHSTQTILISFRVRIFL